MEKKKVSQDFLYQFILERGINVSALAELMGMSAAMVNGCFRHNKDKNGKARNFPARSIPKLNESLVRMAEELNIRKVTFGSIQTYTSNRGITYDPTVIDKIKNLNPYLKVVQFSQYALNWSDSKINATIYSPTSNGYGCITAGDVERINDAITEIVIVFDSIEVVAEDNKTEE